MRRVAIAAFASVLLGQYREARTIATVTISGLNESSGVVASRTHPGLFWTHNDGDGDGESYLYAFDRQGKQRARVRVTGAKIRDWEDLALGPRNQIYIGDIGDNDRGREQIAVFRVAEPDPGQDSTDPVHSIRMRYPDGAHDAEALLVHPKTGDIYIVTKARGGDSKTGVYKAPANAKSPVMLRHIANVDFPDESMISLIVGRVTGGAISPDGKHVVLCDYFRAYEASVPEGNFDGVWKQQWRAVEIGKRGQGEGITYRHDGRALIVTSEGDSFPLIEVERN